ncbi:unnamed protein product [Rhizophagus irregularis]|uniref:Uncharacterized protein n=1 Tax=Rhizophagus irregularis TaxID=588596 RepID=A0A915ZSN4_9GLOM|nr:unnamed protein product [Rhizophagus irregularis]
MCQRRISLHQNHWFFPTFLYNKETACHGRVCSVGLPTSERVFSSYGLSVVFSSWRSKGAPHVIDVHLYSIFWQVATMRSGCHSPKILSS